MKVHVVIVNYRTKELTRDCLASLARHARQDDDALDVHVAVTDNASGDDSVPFLANAIEENHWGNWVTLMPLERNGGFSYGNNAAIERVLESDKSVEFVWLLNPDTVVREGSLQRLVDFLISRPGVGIVGSRLEDPDGTPQRSAFRFPTLSSEFESTVRLNFVSRLLAGSIVAPPVQESACSIDWVAGASMLVRREVFEQSGLLDEEYFMYYEELDFCRQAKLAGWSCWYEPASRVVHLVGQASGITNAKMTPKRRPKFWFDSRRRYFVKNHGVFYAAMVDFVWAVSFSLWSLAAKVFNKPSDDPPCYLLDFVRNSIFLRGTTS